MLTSHISESHILTDEGSWLKTEDIISSNICGCRAVYRQVETLRAAPSPSILEKDCAVNNYYNSGSRPVNRDNLGN